MSQPRYEYRADGYFLCRCECVTCGEAFEMLAIMQAQSECPACRQVREWSRQEKEK